MSGKSPHFHWTLCASTGRWPLSTCAERSKKPGDLPDAQSLTGVWASIPCGRGRVQPGTGRPPAEHCFAASSAPLPPQEPDDWQDQDQECSRWVRSLATLALIRVRSVSVQAFFRYLDAGLDTKCLPDLGGSGEGSLMNWTVCTDLLRRPTGQSHPPKRDFKTFRKCHSCSKRPPLIHTSPAGPTARMPVSAVQKSRPISPPRDDRVGGKKFKSLLFNNIPV